MVQKKIHNKIIAVHPLQLTNGVTVYLEKPLQNDSDNITENATEVTTSNSMQNMALFGGDNFV